MATGLFCQVIVEDKYAISQIQPTFLYHYDAPPFLVEILDQFYGICQFIIFHEGNSSR